MKPSSKYKHNKSKYHIGLENRIIRRYIILNPDFDRVEEMVIKYVNDYTKNYITFNVYCLFKTLTKTSNIKYIRISPTLYILSIYYFLSNIKTNIINKKRDIISKILEMRITFVSIKIFMTYNQYLKQKKHICEIELNQILNRNPSLVQSPNTISLHPMNNYFILKANNEREGEYEEDF